MTAYPITISRHTSFLEGFESGLIYGFADRYWVFRSRARVTETKFRSSVSGYIWIYSLEGASGMNN